MSTVSLFLFYSAVTDAFEYEGHPLSHYWWANRKFLITIISMLFIFPMLFFRRIGILSYTR